jgi:DNA-binding GntR family transcriptional regulator
MQEPSGKTIMFVRELANEYLRQGKRCLPAIASMASLAGVSTVSVWRAVRRLRDEGLLRTVRGGTIELVPLICQESYAQTGGPRTKCGRTAAQLRAEILRGAWLPGDTLPSVKELRSTLGVSYPTLRAALAALARDGMLCQRSRGYMVAPLAPVHSHGTVVLIGASDDAGNLQTFTFRTLDYYRTLENECS